MVFAQVAFILHSFSDAHSSTSGTNRTQQSDLKEAALQIKQHDNDYEVDVCQKKQKKNPDSWALNAGKKIYILSGSRTIIPSLDWNYLSSFFRLLHIPLCNYNCKILWYLYRWHSRGTRFQMSTRQGLEPNEHNKAHSMHAVQTTQRGDDH